MPVDVDFVDPQAVVVHYHGLVTYEELWEAYTTILDYHHQHGLRYFIASGVEMMYKAHIIFDENLKDLANKILFSESFKAAIFISLTNHELAKMTAAGYAERGIPEKLHFVPDYDSAMKLVAEIEEPT